MRTTTTQSASDVTIAALAEGIREQLLQVRRVLLKGRAPRNRRVHQLRRDIACGKARPVEMLLTLSAADLEDGASIESVCQPYDSAVATLRELAARRETTPMPMLTAIRRETRAQAALDEAEFTVLDAVSDSDISNDAAALADAEERALRQLAETQTFISAVRDARARLRVRNAHPYPKAG